MKMKKGLQLSATFLVLLVIIITIFIGSLYFLKQFFTGAEQLKAEIDQSTRAEIEAMLREPGSKVAIPINKATLKRGQSNIFGLGIRNVGAPKTFHVTIQSGGAYKDNQPIDLLSTLHVENNWLLYDAGPYPLTANAYEAVPIALRVGNEMNPGFATEKGTYVFNVCVWTAQPTPADRCEVELQAYAPSEILYDRIHQIYVEVP